MNSLQMRIWTSISTLLLFGSLSAQNLSLPLGNDSYHFIDRLQVLSDSFSGFHSAIKPLLRADVVEFGLLEASSDRTLMDDWQIQYLFDENNEFVFGEESDTWLTRKYVDSTRTFYVERIPEQRIHAYYRESKRPFLKHFYKTPANFFQVDTRNFYLRVNPLLDFSLGKESEEDVTVLYNRRGLELRGGIGHKVYFSTRLIENQARFPNHVNAFTQQFKALPAAGLYKSYKSSFFNIEGGRDFVQADGYIGFDLIPNIGVQLGHGKHFIGDGTRSLILSEFSPEMFYLKFNTRVWKLHYQNLFAELAAEGVFDQPSSVIVEKKYIAAHYLSFKPAENLDFGFFEAVVFHRENGGFELQYLNPIIFFRTLELNLGSPDNALLGFTARWDIRNRISLYGQFLLDDIKITEILDGNLDWWGNKFGGQLGVKYINAFGIENLDLQAETNQVRPYTYSHRDSSSSYTHFNQALAHPLGANFKEWIFRGRYQPLQKWRADFWLSLVSSGGDEGDLNYGSNIVRPNTTRIGQYGMETGQGVPLDITTFNIELGYQIRHNLWLDIQYFNRKKDGPGQEFDLTTSYFLGGIRLNLARTNIYL